MPIKTYKEAFDYLFPKWEFGGKTQQAYDMIKALVELATEKDVQNGDCPTCNFSLIKEYDHCPVCGQALGEWNE